MRGLSFEEYEALYWFCSDYHSGQWSRGYRILCRVGKRFRPGALDSGASDEARPVYDALVNKYASCV